MSAQFVDLGALVGLLSLFATFLWRVMANLRKDMNRRFDKQDGRFDKQDGRFDKQDSEMAELRSGVGVLQTDMAVVKNDLGHVKEDLGHLRNDFRRLESRCDRMDTNIVQIMRDVGRLEGERRSSTPKEKVGAGGS